MSNVGYYLTSKGQLRHCHPAYPDDNRTPEWHDASNVHPATPDAHTSTNAFDPNITRWSKTNRDLPYVLKARLINEARATHDNTLAQRSQTKPQLPAHFNIACPDCGVIFPGELNYHGSGKWDFEFKCSNSKCSNYNYEYVGTLQEK